MTNIKYIYASILENSINTKGGKRVGDSRSFYDIIQATQLHSVNELYSTHTVAYVVMNRVCISDN